MTYDIYAIYKEGVYKVAESTHAEHGMDCAQRACIKIEQWPMGFAALVRGEHVFNCDMFTFDQLKNRKDS